MTRLPVSHHRKREIYKVFDWNLKLQLEATQNWHKVIRIGKFWTQNHGKLYLEPSGHRCFSTCFYHFFLQLTTMLWGWNIMKWLWHKWGVCKFETVFCPVVGRSRDWEGVQESFSAIPKFNPHTHTQKKKKSCIIKNKFQSSTNPKTPKKGCITEKSSNKNTSSTNISAYSSWPPATEKGTCQTTSSSTNGTCQGAHRFILTFRNEFPHKNSHINSRKWIPKPLWMDGYTTLLNQLFLWVFQFRWVPELSSWMAVSQSLRKLVCFS